MANTKISNLTGAASVTDASVFPVVDSGSTKKVTGTQIKTYARSGLSTVATSGSYTDLTNKPTLFDGSYTSLTNKPSIPDGTYANLTGKPTLFSGSYLDLTNKPALFGGSYNDLTDTPVLFSGAYADLTGKPTLFSGSYVDLSDKPTIPTDVSDLTDNNSLLGQGGGGGASTGNITFADTTMTSTNGDINISFEPTASPAVSFSFTQTGTFIASSILTGTVEVGNSIRVGQTKMFSTDTVQCLPNIDTVIYTGSDTLTSTIKALFHVEGAEDGSSGYDAQSCEMMIAQMNNRVAGSVYGLAYTSNAPLATLSTRINSTTNLIEILCRPASTTSSVYVATTATEMFTAP